MTTRTLAIACTALLLSCSGKKGGQDADAEPADDALEVEDGTDADDDAPTGVTPIAPEMGTLHTVGVDCRDAYTLPAEFTSDEGLGHHGWTLDDLQFTLAWSVDNRFDNNWISRNDASTPSLRTHPYLVPEAGYCYKREVAAALEGDEILVPLLEGVSAFSHPESTYSGLEKDVYTPPDYALTGEDVLAAAIRGLFELPNELPGAPDVVWDETVETDVLSQIGTFPEDVSRALAKLVLAIGEAYLLKQAALADADDGAMQRIHQQFLDDYYATLDTTMAHPLGGTMLMDMLQNGTWVHYEYFHAAAMSVAGAAEELLAVLETTTPQDEGVLQVLTPHGMIMVDLGDEDTTYTAEQLADAVVVVDLAGNDSYGGRYASTHRYWMSASVLVDASGDDLYTPETYDIEDPATTKFEAFMNEHGFTQGAGLCGVGVLVDGAGADTYTASMYAQGSGTFGVGILHDVDGADQYRLGTGGQGAGYFGIGLHLESGGDDRYGVYTIGQGAGKPYGHGALIDRQGTDTYIAYYNEMEPWLPGPAYNNYFSLTSAWPYSDSEGNPHYMSNAQGVGWGFRHEWVEPADAWMGGFGALLDLGTGNDEHYADCMSMGQGFVYGFGFLYDEGGDDRYRTFWWGPAAAAHMGVGLFVDEDGNDDLHVAHASGGFGYDCSVGWLIDNGGNDTYGGQFHYGKGYTWGLTFMINSGGDDVYNDGSVLADPPFGIVQKAYAGVNLVGMFMDLGGGADTYNTAYAGVGNDALWYHEPIGDDADPAFHKGVGIDK